METRDAPKAMLVVICAAALSRPAAIAAQPATRAERLIYHPIASDAQGRIVPWNAAEPGKSYDDILRRIWTFWRTMRTDRNGVRYFMQHQVWKELEDDQRGLGGDQVAMALSSWNLLHGYLGDRAIVDNMVSMADYYLAHSFSKPSGAWPNLPYPYNTDLYSGEYDGDMVAGKGSLQPDKAASFAAELVMLSKITGTARYLEAAVRMADVLAERVRPGDERNSPWPFRVDAATGAVHRSTATAPSRVSITGTTRQPSYTTNFAPALRLFDDLIAMKQGHLTAYRKAHRLLTTWLKRFPIANNRWGPFFEDVPTHDYSDTEINAETLAWYILQRRAEWDPAWQRQVAGILSWVDATFSDTSWARYGVIATREQTDYPVPGNSHTARHASVELAFCQATGECARAPGAVLCLNWAT